jgi:hypothetical protein
MLFWIDIIFTILFTIEAMFKITALGFFCNKMPAMNAYITNGWNILDFLVVGASLVDLFMMSAGGGGANLKSLKALRALRAL